MKLYCQCFAASTTCGSKCRCDECYNTAGHGLEIDSARRNILSRNPVAFHRAKILLYQQQEERQPHFNRLQTNSNHAPYPHQAPPPMNGPYYGNHPVHSNHMHYYPGAPIHHPPPHIYRPPPLPSPPTPSDPIYHSSIPRPQQHAPNQFYATTHQVDRQNIRPQKSNTCSTTRPSVVEISPEMHVQATSPNGFVTGWAAMHQDTPPPMPPRLQIHQEGCNCRRTNCLKKYCECYQQSIYCCGNCKCVDCKNYPGASLHNNTNQNGADNVALVKNKDLVDPSPLKRYSDHSGIKLHYRPERPPQMHTQDPGIIGTSSVTKEYGMQMPTKRSISCCISNSTDPNAARVSRIPVVPPTIPLKEDVKLLALTIRSVEEDSPRTVVQESVTPKNTTPATADDAMIQAAMAMTELLNGIASTASPYGNTNEQKSTLVLSNELKIDRQHRVSDIEIESYPSSPDFTARPHKKFKVSENESTEQNVDVEKTISSSSRTHLLSPNHRQYQRMTPNTYHAPSHQPVENRLTLKSISHHQRSLPMSSRSHLIPAASSLSSSSSSLDSDDYVSTKHSGTRTSTSSTFITANNKRRNPFETITLTSGLPKALSFRKICSRCGRTRSEHGEMGFGNSCSFETCGRCGAAANCHQKAGKVMGVLCQLSVIDGATHGASTIYQRKLRDLATRADLERQNIHRRKQIFV